MLIRSAGGLRSLGIWDGEDFVSSSSEAGDIALSLKLIQVSALNGSCPLGEFAHIARCSLPNLQKPEGRLAQMVWQKNERSLLGQVAEDHVLSYLSYFGFDFLQSPFYSSQSLLEGHALSLPLPIGTLDAELVEGTPVVRLGLRSSTISLSIVLSLAFLWLSSHARAGR